MGLTGKKFKIGERTYSVLPLSMEEGGDEGLVRILALVAPMAAEARKMGTGVTQLANSGEEELQKAGDRILGTLGQLVAGLDHATMKFFVDLFGPKTTVDIGAGVVLDKPANREMAFDGDYLAKFEWLGRCLWMNYSGFFVGALGRIGIALKPRAPTS